MKKHEYVSVFAPFISGLYQQKISIGYEYICGAAALKRLDSFFVSKDIKSPILTKEIAFDWCEKRPHEKSANRNARATTIRQLGVYMRNLGYDAYVYPQNLSEKAPSYIPHIFSDAELAKIFQQADNCRPTPQSPNRHITMPLLFRVLYCCGLRISEALNLKVCDVDLQQGVLTIKGSKFNKDRLIPMSQELTERFKRIFGEIHRFSANDDFLFITRINKPIGAGTAYANFRSVLKQAGISHGGKGNGPRLHDFRHTMAVHCLRKWVNDGKDLQAYLPVLKTYLGHNSFFMTACYLRLTADVYPDLMLRIEKDFGGLIPSFGGVLYEAD
jgi:integrase